MTVAVLDSMADVRAAVGSDSGPLTEQELRELDRIEGIRRSSGLATHYAVCVEADALCGFLPVYPTPSWFLPARRIARLLETEPGDWSQILLLGSDATAPNSIVIAPNNRKELLNVALSNADHYGSDVTCLPLVDDQQRVAVAPLLPKVVVGRYEEAYFDLPFDSFADYVMALPHQRRRHVRRERRAFLESGLTMRSAPPARAVDLAPMVYQVESKHDSSTTPELVRLYLETTAAAMGDNGLALIVSDRSDPIAMVLLWDVGTHWRVRCLGCDYSNSTVRAASVYFNLVFYEPITRAIAAGVSRLVVGAGSLECKLRRGAHTRTLHTVGWEGRLGRRLDLDQEGCISPDPERAAREMP